MKKLFLIFMILLLCYSVKSYSQIFTSVDAAKKIAGTSVVAFEKDRDLPVYIKMKQGNEINFNNWQPWIFKALGLSPEMGFMLTNTQKDQQGELHYRYVQTYNNIEIFGTDFIIHTRNGQVFSFNGKIIPSVNSVNINSLKENQALSSALLYVNAEKYKWEIPGEESFLKESTGNPSATFYPTGMLFYVPVQNGSALSYKLSYRFDIYASKPLKRSYVFVDAQSGEILKDINRIHVTNVLGTAVTKYSGTQPIMTDSTGVGSYRLRETSRGNGIETYNLQTSTNYGSAVDFTDTDNYWNNVNTAQDEIASDAHWGAEMTYDYYYNTFGINSIDDNGLKLVSYVHYDVNYDNAFWDGTRMTYGDGDGATYHAFTALDICGHEITHGLDEKTANLNYQDESGALNEGFSDIFGTCIEKYAKPATANWTMGEDIGTIIRSLAAPKLYACPNTYQGAYWYTGTQDNGGVHTNCGVVGYWFYLLAHGGSGTNDNSVPYNITGLGMNSAAQIAYRTLTVYLTNTSNYADTRYYSILAAIDLFGPCTNEVEIVANAWYACGVGGAYDSTVVANFSPSFTTFCDTSATVHFTNNSANSNVFLWDFGDGNTSTDINPDHTYNSFGYFTVTLISSGGSCGKDTIVMTNIISVDSLNPCSHIMPQTGTAAAQTECSGLLFDSGGTGNYQDNTNSTITIQPPGASTITLTFSTFSFENGYDFLKIYDGANQSSPLIGSYTGTSLPNGGTITSTYGAITIVQTSDMALNDSGFVLQWQCNYPTTPPVTNFKVGDTLSCSGDVQFTDLTLNGPITWHWDFGDSDTSILQHPLHSYLNDGAYSITLITTNSLGADTLTKPMYVTVDKPETPVTTSAWRCDPGSVTLTGSGGTSLNWYDAPVGGNLVFVGNTFVTPHLNSTTIYYVQDVIPVVSKYVGPANNTIGSGGYSTSPSSRYEKFDCYTPVMIASVLVYSDSSFVRTITLSDSSGTVIQDTAIFISDTTMRINLNFNVPVGTGLRLGLGSGSGSHLYRNQNGAVYPYLLQDILSITGSSSFSPNAYYYFYDWEITGGQCSSSRVASVANIQIPASLITPSGNIEICVGNSVTLTSIPEDSYLWSPGGETTQSIVVNAAGDYFVHVTDSICSSSDTVHVSVVNAVPTAAFTYSVNSLMVTFTNTSTSGSSYIWDFGDGNTSLLTDPTHTYSVSGTYSVTLITENACGADTTVIAITVTTGVKENSENLKFTIYPNPSDGLFNVDISGSLVEGRINYSIYDIIGKLIQSGTVVSVNGESHGVIDISSISKGIYFIRLSNNSMNITQKIVLK